MNVLDLSHGNCSQHGDLGRSGIRSLLVSSWLYNYLYKSILPPLCDLVRLYLIKWFSWWLTECLLCLLSWGKSCSTEGSPTCCCMTEGGTCEALVGSIGALIYVNYLFKETCVGD